MRGWLLFAVVALSGCSVREYVIDQSIAEQIDFVPDPKHFSGSELRPIADHVYTWRATWNRSIAIDTDEGWVVIDPFTAAAAADEKAALEKQSPGKPVRALFYSHYHLDHVPGGAVLAPKEVIAHAKCPAYWKDLADDPQVKGILPPTKLIEGDQTMTFGGVELRLIDLGHSHTDTLYAFYLPKQKVLFTSDTGLKKTLYPIGGPDMYWPGLLKAMDQLAQLDFDVWVPSHFNDGTKADFEEQREFLHEIRRLALETAKLYGGAPGNSETFVKGFHHSYDALKAKYGDYHGFDQEVVFLVARSFTGALLGF